MLSLPHGRVLLIIGWALVILTIVGSLGPALPKIGVGGGDKVMHFLGYFGLTIWFAGLYPRKRLWVIAVAFVFMGATLEVLQGTLTTNREMDVMDLAFNTLGIIMACVFALLGLSAWALRFEAWLMPRKP
jgi:VanZ family protein